VSESLEKKCHIPCDATTYHECPITNNLHQTIVICCTRYYSTPIMVQNGRFTSKISICCRRCYNIWIIYYNYKFTPTKHPRSYNLKQNRRPNLVYSLSRYIYCRQPFYLYPKSSRLNGWRGNSFNSFSVVVILNIRTLYKPHTVSCRERVIIYNPLVADSDITVYPIDCIPSLVLISTNKRLSRTTVVIAQQFSFFHNWYPLSCSGKLNFGFYWRR
jgi:hypothetical protein